MTRFPEVGRCIYCGSSEGKLTSEHIIPFALGGKVELPAASCKPCAAITGRFEQVVLRDTLYHLRNHNSLPTRRPKERPTHREFRTSKGQAAAAPVEEYPATYWVYTFGVCGFFLGMQKNIDVSLGNVKTIFDKEKLDRFQREYDWDGVEQMRYMPNEFRRMLLKIGYAYAVSQVGYGEFDPICTPYILGTEHNISYLVGQNAKQEAMIENGGHQQRLVMELRGDHAVLAAEVRLFSGADTPTYHAVVGLIHGLPKARQMLERMGVIEEFVIGR